jgi:hypothetical protein
MIPLAGCSQTAESIKTTLNDFSVGWLALRNPMASEAAPEAAKDDDRLVVATDDMPGNAHAALIESRHFAIYKHYRALMEGPMHAGLDEMVDDDADAVLQHAVYTFSGRSAQAALSSCSMQVLLTKQ